ncbi:MAG: asparagine--tRNA ligase [Candidatus Competibacterales bacterium]
MTSPSQPIRALLGGAYPLETPVTVRGWVRTRRDSKAGMSFVNVHDGSCFDALQVVAPSSLANYQDQVLHLSAGCSVEIRGHLQASPGQNQAVELVASELAVVGWVDNPDTYPMAPKRHSFEHLRAHAHLRPRTNSIGAVARVRHALAQAIHGFLHDQGFFWVNTPIITGSDCEGAGELFRVSTLDLLNPPRRRDGGVDFAGDFFGRETFLTVSGQLNVESYCLALSKVYTFGPTFRAENSNTSRHLAEFWMVEPEIAFADLEDLAALAEALLKAVFKAVLDTRGDDMAFFAKHIDRTCIERLENVVNRPFEWLDYGDAIAILERAPKAFEFPVAWGMDLQSEHERYLAEEHVKGPVVIANYPAIIKSFYMRLNDDQRTVAALDVLAPGIGEIIGGSQREERLDVLERRLDDYGMDKALYRWYLDLRRYGTVPHSGFGLGFERTLSYITGMANVRDVIPFPRTPGNAEF